MHIGHLEIWSLLTDKLCDWENKFDLKFEETRQILKKFDLKFEENQKILSKPSLVRKLKNLTKFKVKINP
jgi:hypothetical protein